MQLLCLILERHKHILSKDLYQSVENNRVQSVNSAFGLRELENIIINLIPTTVNFRRNLDISPLLQSPVPITRFKSCTALLQDEKPAKRIMSNKFMPYKLQSKAQSSIFFIKVWWSCLPETNVISNAYLSKQLYVSIYISGAILQLNF